MIHHFVIYCVLSIIIRDFLAFEIRKNLDLRKILFTSKIFLKSRFMLPILMLDLWPLFKFQYRYFDGRSNIRVGNGRFYSRDYDRTVEIECNFPSNTGGRILSNISWYRKSFNNQDYYPRVRGFSGQSYSTGYPILKHKK